MEFIEIKFFFKLKMIHERICICFMEGYYMWSLTKVNRYDSCCLGACIRCENTCFLGIHRIHRWHERRARQTYQTGELEKMEES